jgi:hypothetical protein
MAMGDSIVRVGVYARISEDRDGQQTATARQMQDAREFAVRKGWEIVDTFEDVDLSAYNTRVKRPEFERMLDALWSPARGRWGRRGRRGHWNGDDQWSPHCSTMSS